MSLVNSKTPEGNLYIANDVIASIAYNAAREVSGFAGLSKLPSPSKILGRGDGKHSIEIKSSQTGIEISIAVNLKSDASIQNAVKLIQTNIKNSVQNMTGNVVKSVNVTVDDIVFDD